MDAIGRDERWQIYILAEAVTDKRWTVEKGREGGVKGDAETSHQQGLTPRCCRWECGRKLRFEVWRQWVKLGQEERRCLWKCRWSTPTVRWATGSWKVMEKRGCRRPWRTNLTCETPFWIKILIMYKKSPISYLPTTMTHKSFRFIFAI